MDKNFIMSNSYEVRGMDVISTNGGTEISLAGDSSATKINLGKSNSTTVQVFLPGQVTASGNINASKNLFIDSGSTIGITGSANSPRGMFSVDYGNGSQITGSLTSAGHGYGDIVRIGTGTTNAGQIYWLRSDSDWIQTDANVSSFSSSLMAVALGTDPASDGMLLKGFAKISQSSATTIGQKVYVSNEAGVITGSAPTTSGDIVRVLGYVLSASNSSSAGSHSDVHFNPSNTWIKIS